MDDFVNRRPAIVKKEVVIRPTKEVAEELSKIKNGDITNRDYIAKTLEYRKHTSMSLELIHSQILEPMVQINPLKKQKQLQAKTLLDENPSPVDLINSTLSYKMMHNYWLNCVNAQ